jgi:hypothetical protein
MEEIKEQEAELIAKFMGFEIGEVGYFGMDDETKWQVDNEKLLDELGIEAVGKYAVNRHSKIWSEFEYLKYSSDWNWLMPVVEKIEGLHSIFEHYYLNVRISQGYVQIEGVKGHRIYFNTSVEGGKIKATYKAVVEFIKYYNDRNL